MSASLQDRPGFVDGIVIGRRRGVVLTVLLGLVLGCGGATRGASVPHSKTTTTAAVVTAHMDRLVVAEKGSVSMVARDGCMATVNTSESESGAQDELRVRCPKPERLEAWFNAADRVMATFAFVPVDDEENEVQLPAAKILTAGGRTFKVARPADVRRLAGEVRALAAELASTEQPTPGPASPAGWQMLHVSGPAHVLFAGTPARGVLEARVSTNGQYLCEFVATVGDGPMRATKSGWIPPATATRAIDEVLLPFNALDPQERARTTYAAGTKEGAETRTNASSTAAVFERFASVQDALGDACLPELEPPQVGL
jgi:hypothetical protein